MSAHDDDPRHLQSCRACLDDCERMLKDNRDRNSRLVAENDEMRATIERWEKAHELFTEEDLRLAAGIDPPRNVNNMVERNRQSTASLRWGQALLEMRKAKR